ncbi:MAG: response regulator transcription factor [Anderseniella sp.]|jgi:DNA-binding response OmpR family regulator|nr:response regulator transcription factor [Anderseniella sp.]
MDANHHSRPLRLLVIEDNLDIAENIGDYFQARGGILDFAMDGIGGLHLALTHPYDVIILDIMLPGMDGLTLCRKLRKEAFKAPPVLMLTARDTLNDKLEGFASGADDYLVKPFALRELAARIEALLKRGRPVDRPILRVADLEMDLGRMEARRAGRLIKLNRVCMQILTILMKAYPNVTSRDELETALWGEMPPGSDALRSHIYALRRAIDKPFTYPLLQTMHGIGYRLAAPDENSQ